MNDVDRTPRPSTTHPPVSLIEINGNVDRDSPDDFARSSPDDGSIMSRSSSKASSIEGKPPKPRRPTNFGERTSSIHKRTNSHVPNLKLNQAVLTATNESSSNVPSPPISTNISPKPNLSPVLERTQEDHANAPTSSPTDTPKPNPELIERPYFPLPLPTRPQTEVAKAPATQMYWHQPPVHGMLSTAPMRRSHSIAQIGATVYIFGGSDGKPPKATNTIFIFDTGIILSIPQLMLDTSFWRIPTVQGTLPPPLRAHTTTPHRQKIYLFGGGTGNNDYYNHVYVFSAQTYRWTCLIASNRSDTTLPCPRRAHTSVLFESAMYIFGGGSGASGLNDLWRLDLTSPPHWTQLHPTGRKPEPRVYHTATVVRDVMIIYGGLDGKQCFSNIFLYNFVSNTYIELIVPVGPRLCRIAHTTTCVGSQLFVFGGSDGTVFNNELWVFDLTSRTWAMRPCSGAVPLARGYHTSLFHDARLWVFGGMDTVREGFNDVNVLEFGGSGYLGSVYVDHVR